MNIIRSSIDYEPLTENVTVTILTTGAVGDHAAYRAKLPYAKHGTVAHLTGVACREGYKLTAAEAEKVFGPIENYRS